MKRIFALCIAVLMAVGIASCAKVPDEPEATVKTSAKTTTRLATEGAVLKEAEAIERIKSYSAKELGLSDQDMKECAFMVAKYGEMIDGEKYVKVVAAVKTESKDSDGEVLYSLKNKGEYYISFDGEEILIKNLKDNTYSALDKK